MYRFVSKNCYNRIEWLGKKVDSKDNDNFGNEHIESGEVVAYCESVEYFAKMMGIEIEDINDCGLYPE